LSPKKILKKGLYCIAGFITYEGIFLVIFEHKKSLMDIFFSKSMMTKNGHHSLSSREEREVEMLSWSSLSVAAEYYTARIGRITETHMTCTEIHNRIIMNNATDNTRLEKKWMA
jgi:hypothetical protein